MIALIQMVHTVAKALGSLNKHAVFVGGSTVPLYLPEELQKLSRPTEDVDVVLNLVPKVKLHKMESLLREKGFKNDISEGAPLCRWKLGTIQVDVVSPDKSIHGFTNKWYKEGVNNTINRQINGLEIHILSLPFFLATKMEAYKDRGRGDLLASHDIEDIISILELVDIEYILSEIHRSAKDVQDFLATTFDNLEKSHNITEAVEGNTIARDGSNTSKVLSAIHRISKM